VGICFEGMGEDLIGEENYFTLPSILILIGYD